MNVLFTDFCNQKCPYCFADLKLSSGGLKHNNYISLDNLKRVIDYSKRSKEQYLGVLGGEPTLHPDFIAAIKSIINSGLKVKIFTNGIIRNQKVVSFLKNLDNKKCMLVVNINELEFYGKNKDLGIIKNSLKILHDKIFPGFTIYRKDFKPDFLINLIRTYKLNNKIRLGIASPIFGHNNQHVRLEEHRIIAKRIVKFAKQCDAFDIVLDFDCGFTLCSFTEEECGKLQYYNSPLKTDCPFPIDIAPDLTVWCCFAISGSWNKRMDDFKDVNEIRQFYRNKFMALSRAGGMQKCLRCKFLRRKQCSGGCLAHTLRSFKVNI